MSSGSEKETVTSKEDGVKPEGEEESEELAGEVQEESEELKLEKIEGMETEHEKAKRRKRGNNTQ